MWDVKAGLVIAGRYRLDAQIGEGGMAQVWRATDLTLSRVVAVKALREDVSANADAVARFRREAQAAAKLNHPSIVQIYDTGVDGAIHYIVMECLMEPDLKRIIREWAPLPEDRVIDVAEQCCRALAYAHRHGIVHRDVKPHNILFTDEGRAKLSDFGIAAAAGTGGAPPGGYVLGTAQYISPEQVQGSPAGPHSDLYSLGCVMYEALTGRPPFTGDTEAEVAAKHLRERPVPVRSLNPSVSPHTEYVVSKAMAREVAKRYRTAEELLSDLVKVSGGEDLDRTGVLPASQAPTVMMQPQLAPRAPAAPGVTSARGDLEVEPTPTVRAPERATTVSPVIRPPAHPRRSPWPLVAALSIAVIALATLVLLAKVAPGRQADKTVQVPSLKGMSLAEARETLKSDELLTGKIDYKQDRAQPDGTVIKQTPGEGQSVKVGTVVDLIVNRGTELVTVPTVERMTLAEGGEALAGAGLRVGEKEYRYHTSIPSGRVIKQAPKSGTNMEKGAEVTLTLSKGLEPLTPTAPATPADNHPTSGTNPPLTEPEVQLEEDASYEPSTPGTRRFIVTVTVQGQRLGQEISVWKQDSEGHMNVATMKLNPNESRPVRVTTVGHAFIEVQQEGKTVWKEVPPAGGRP